jgi:hypothetical protein
MLGNGGMLGASAAENQKTELDAQSPASTRLAALNLAQRNYLGVGAAIGISTASTVSSAARRAIVFGGSAAARKLGNSDLT